MLTVMVLKVDGVGDDGDGDGDGGDSTMGSWKGTEGEQRVEYAVR